MKLPICFRQALILLLLWHSALSAQPLPQQTWHLQEVHCLQTCSPKHLTFYQPLRNQALLTGPQTFQFALLDTCDGEIVFRSEMRSRRATEQEIRASLPPQPKPKLARLNLPTRTQSLLVECRTQASLNTLARLLSVEAQRILMLHEGGVVLEFHPGPADGSRP